jgi:hypothetical protein
MHHNRKSIVLIKVSAGGDHSGNRKNITIKRRRDTEQKRKGLLKQLYTLHSPKV